MKKIKTKTVIAMRKCSEVLCDWLPVYIYIQSHNSYVLPKVDISKKQRKQHTCPTAWSTICLS